MTDPKIAALLVKRGHSPELDVTVSPTYAPQDIGDGSEPCTLDPDCWFPSGPKEELKIAMRWCRRCPRRTRERCLIWALHACELGVWGGTTESDRVRLRRYAKAAVRGEEAA